MITENINKIKRLFRKISKSVNIGSGTSNSKYSIYQSLLDRTDNRVPYIIGKRIMRDTQVGTGFDIIKYLLSSKQWILTNVEDEDTEVYDFIKDMLQNMDTKLNMTVKQMSSAILWGYNVHEIIYDVNQDNKIVVKKLIPVHIKTLQDNCFKYDDNGDLEFIHQVSGIDTVDIPADKVVLYSFGSMYGELEGHGLLYDFRPIVEDKENLMDWLMTFAERNGSPTMYGKTDDPTSRDQLLDAFDDIADGTTGMVVGVDDDVGVLESSHRGEIFFSALQYKDNQIFRRMFIGNLLMGDNSQTGTYAQSQTQLEFGNMVFDGILEEVANIFQTQIIDPIVNWNFGSERKAPVISFEKFTRGDMQKLFSILQPLIQGGVVDGENTAVQESLALLFKSEAGVEYVNEEPEMPPENFGYQENPVDSENLTDNILGDLSGITG